MLFAVRPMLHLLSTSAWAKPARPVSTILAATIRRIPTAWLPSLRKSLGDCSSFVWNRDKQAWEQVQVLPFRSTDRQLRYLDRDVLIDIREPNAAEVSIAGKLVRKTRRGRSVSRSSHEAGKRGMPFLAFVLRWLLDQPNATGRFDDFVNSLAGTAFEGSTYARVENGRPDNFRKQVRPFSQDERWQSILLPLQKGGSAQAPTAALKPLRLRDPRRCAIERTEFGVTR